MLQIVSLQLASQRSALIETGQRDNHSPYSSSFFSLINRGRRVLRKNPTYNVRALGSQCPLNVVLGELKGRTMGDTDTTARVTLHHGTAALPISEI